MYRPHPLFLLSFQVRQLFHSYPALCHHDIITTALVKHVCLLIIKCTRMYLLSWISISPWVSLNTWWTLKSINYNC